jgi:Polymerase beta, Nucleotidyltransferase
MNRELRALAEILADWIEPAPGVPVIYLFGSRARGDHRPDSDVDGRLFLDEWRDVTMADMKWWDEQNETDCRAEIAPSRPAGDPQRTIGRGRPGDPQRQSEPVLVVGRVVCVWTPPTAWR